MEVSSFVKNTLEAAFHDHEKSTTRVRSSGSGFYRNYQIIRDAEADKNFFK